MLRPDDRRFGGQSSFSGWASVALGCFLAVVLGAPAVGAQSVAVPAEGFALERFYAAPPGSDWLVLDDLNVYGKLGGALGLVGGYARNPLRLEPRDGGRPLGVVSDQAFVDVGMAVASERLRVSLHLAGPLHIGGHSGQVDGASFTAPAVNLGDNPDMLSDVRLGAQARLFGLPRSALRLGADAELIIPSGDRAHYVTDGTYRAMGRALLAGDIPMGGATLRYAAHAGLHVRPLDDAQWPGSPRGHELLWGAAVGPSFSVGRSGRSFLGLGAEAYGASAVQAPFSRASTAFELLGTVRWLQRIDGGAEWRMKLGVGPGLPAHFGAPAVRAVAAIEISGRASNAPQDR